MRQTCATQVCRALGQALLGLDGGSTRTVALALGGDRPTPARVPVDRELAQAEVLLHPRDRPTAAIVLAWDGRRWYDDTSTDPDIVRIDLRRTWRLLKEQRA